MCRVAVVVEFNLTGDTLRVALLRHGFQVMGVGLPTSTTELRALGVRLDAFRPHAAVLLHEMAEPAHQVAAMRMLSELREHPWLLLEGAPPGPEWGRGLAAGARAVLSLTTGLDTLSDVLDRMCRGSEVMDPRERERLIALWAEASESSRRHGDRLATLTPREMQVLQELHRGRTVSEIANDRGVTVGTVRSQVKAILRKLDVSSQLAAVAVLQQAAGLDQ